MNNLIYFVNEGETIVVTKINPVVNIENDRYKIFKASN